MRVDRKVLVLNQSYQPINLISVKKAVILAWRDKVETVEISDLPLRSSTAAYPMPLVVRLKGRVKYDPFRRVELNRRNIFKRDGHTCVYCGSRDDLTLDHVLPKSRGGRSIWENLVTACHICNNKKDCKTPEEAGLTLLKKPKKPSHILLMTKELKLDEKWKPYLYMV